MVRTGAPWKEARTTAIVPEAGGEFTRAIDPRPRGGYRCNQTRGRHPNLACAGVGRRSCAAVNLAATKKAKKTHGTCHLQGALVGTHFRVSRLTEQNGSGLPDSPSTSDKGLGSSTSDGRPATNREGRNLAKRAFLCVTPEPGSWQCDAASQMMLSH